MRSFILLFTLLVSFPAWSQKTKSAIATPKKPLSHEVYDTWKEITFRSVTTDGTFAAYTINPQDGDGKVVFHNLKTFAQDSIKRAADIALTWDSRYAIFKIKPQQEAMKELRRQKKKKEDLPKDSLGIYALGNRKIEKIPSVKSYKIPEKAGGWLAYQLEAPKEVKPTPGKSAEKPDSTKKVEKPKKVKKNTDDNGYTLVLRNLTNNSEIHFGFVKEYAFAKFGQGLLFSSTGSDSLPAGQAGTLAAGVYWYDLQTNQLNKLYEGKSKYKVKGLAINEDGTQTAFLVDTDTTKSLLRYFKLYHWKKGEPAALLMADEKTSGVPSDWIVSEHFTPHFAKDGSKLFFGTSPKPIVQDTTLLAEEIVNVEVWTGNDPYIYPQQNRRLEADKKRSYLSVIHLTDKKIVQLATPENPTLQLGDEGNSMLALFENNTPYLVMQSWDIDVYKDLLLINLANGTTQPIAKKIKGNATLSPKTNYVVWYSNPDTAWFSYSVNTKKIVKLNEGLKEKFADEEDDHPYYPSSYGSAGFTSQDALFLAYDRYDIWAFDPENRKAPVNLTKIGRKEKIQFRYIRLDREERFIDPDKEMLLTAFNETTKQSGYYKLSLKDGKFTKLIMSDYRFNNILKTQNANTLLFTRESFREFPDVWTTDFNFASPKKLSNANPQMSRYFWGTVELVSWTSLDNVPLQGLLYKPENFDPRKKYPMLVYFYEKESDNLHAHVPPTPLRSAIHRTTYVSDGYLVFIPDIVYKTGFPGESAHNSILPGVTSLIAKGFVDEKNIGIQGHSWGGYQTAYLLTRSNLFKAAEAGAIVANMISAYGGIRWETGLSRMFQYEQSQSRLGGSLWEKPLLYIENSPVFFADRIQTPLLLLHNDADGHVPWYQGIEMYMAMRRLNKPVWMLNYNGEPHWPLKRENRMDFQIRLKQFFDHYLKDSPMPEWMKRGVPAVEKGINQGY
jgi:dipeptidyl aminopeptidase/acylaminoacyl peptidase